MLASCNCKNDFMDKEHGVGIRVYNPCGGKYKGKYRCTNCLNEKWITPQKK